jgi:hypothetical protein
MDYMTLITVIEDLDGIRNMAELERLLIKYELEADSIESKMASEYDFDFDDGA